MSGSAISWKRVKRLDRERGETFVHAWTYVHDWWHCIRHDGSDLWVNVISGETEPGDEAHESSTMHLLRDRTPRTDHDAEYLASLDARFMELGGQVHAT